MTRNESINDSLNLPDTIEEAVAKFGRLPVLFWALVATVRPNRPPPLTAADELPKFLKRDVGLPDASGFEPRKHWQL